MVWADSHRISRALWYSGAFAHRSIILFVYEALTLYGCPFQNNSTKYILIFSVRDCSLWTQMSHYPIATTQAGYHIATVSAVPVSLTTTQGITSFSLPSATEMFQFTPFASLPYIFR